MNFSEQSRVWVIALGEGSFQFENDYDTGVISIGWDDLGDLRQYSSVEEIDAALIKKHPNGNDSQKNNRLACYSFANVMSVGDLVYIRHGVRQVLGYGFVSGEYSYDEAREVHKHTRKLSWQKRGFWDRNFKGEFHRKTLTELTSFKDLTKKLEQLVEFDDGKIIYPDTVADDEVLIEGAKIQTTVNAYERNPEARKKCIEKFGLNCQVCDFNFESVYGEIGFGFIHVHHLKELRLIKKQYEVNPEEDLRPVCPNCHAMLHKKIPALSIEELRDKISSAKRSRAA